MVITPEEIEEYQVCKEAVLQTLQNSHTPLHPRDLIQGAAKSFAQNEGRISEAMWLLVKAGRVRLTDEHDVELTQKSA